MLSQKTIDRLNQQINLEIYSCHLYLQMSSWCAYQSFNGCATFLSQRVDEEMMQMRRLFNYLQETGALATIYGLQAPPANFNSLIQVFEQIYEHEQLVTSKINDLVNLANTESNYATCQFLQWCAAEQHQEEFLFKSILDKIKLIGTEEQGIVLIDREIADLAAGRTSALDWLMA